MSAKQVRIEIGFGIEQDRNHGVVTEASEKIHRIENEAVNVFGAYTLYQSHGGWRHPDGRLAIEEGRTLLTFQDEQPGLKEKVVRFAQFVKTVLNQESVAVGITSADFSCV